MVLVNDDFIETNDIFGYQGMPALKKIFEISTMEQAESHHCFMAFDQAYEDKIFSLPAEER